jgi:hypothetical protein
MTDSDLNFLVAVIGCLLAAFWVIGRIWLAVAGRGLNGSSGANSGRSVAVRRGGAVAWPGADTWRGAPASTAASPPASSAAGFGLLIPGIVIAVVIVVLPVAMLLDGAEPGPVVMWIAMMAVVMAVSAYGRGASSRCRSRASPTFRRWNVSRRGGARRNGTSRARLCAKTHRRVL